jgi:FKBP-type peptidyl-prolyl cis-trans isomerase (trigger factor)
MKFNLTLPQTTIQSEYQVALKAAAREMSIKGFRKGKAPLNVVEQNADKAKLYELVIDQTLPKLYADYIKVHDLKPITAPKITIKSAKDKADWEFEAEIAEKPEVKLNDYQKAVHDSKPKAVILDKDGKKPEDTESKTLTLIFDALLKTCSVEIPALLINNEVEHSLSRLLNQIEKLGLTLEQYLKSLATDVDKLKAEYQQTAEANLKLEFILMAIADDQKLVATEANIDDFIKNVTNQKVKEQLKDHSDARNSLAYTLTKHNVIDYLKSL